MKRLILFTLLMLSTFSYAQPWSPSGTCDFTDGQQWNNGGAKGCACTWYSVVGTDTILNCAFGDCGQNALFECVYDCNGHNGFATDMVARQCDVTATPVCWFNGAGSQGELFCQNIALPIELIEFWGEAKDTYNEIHWETATEFENDYFIISHSTTGETFEDLIEVDGAGTTSEPMSYHFRHIEPERGANYYKIRQVDYNGDSEEFPVISVNNNLVDTRNLFSDVYPNPSSGQFFFHYTGNKFNSPIMIKIKTLVGRTLIEGVIDNFNSNSQAISFMLMDVSSGHYMLEISQGSTTEIKKLVVEK